jgi:DNA repair protein RadC
MLPADACPPHAEYLLTKIEKGDLARERITRVGPAALKNEELLAIILRTGTKGENVLDLAERLLRENHGLGGLARVPLTELTRVKGIGTVKAIELLAALELGRRLNTTAPEDKPIVNLRWMP